jgi:hypothetical protein
VVLNSSQAHDCLPRRLLVALNPGLEVEADTWGRLVQEVAAWIEETERRVYHDRVLVIGDEDSGADEGDSARWRLRGSLVALGADIPIDCPRQCFCMCRGSETVAFMLLTDILPETPL